MSHFFAFSFLDQGSLWAVNVVIHSTVLTAFSLLIVKFFHRTAVIRYWILCCGMLLVLGSPAISALIQTRGNSWLAFTASTAEITVAEVPGAVPGDALPASVPQTPDTIGSIAPAPLFGSTPELAMESLNSLTSDSQPQAPIDSSATLVETSAKTWSLTDWMRVIVVPVTLIWTIGTTILLLRMSVAWVHLSRILRRAEPIEDTGLQQRFVRACQAVGCDHRRGPKFLASDEVSGPIATGIFGGSVVLPKQLIEQVDPAQLADVLVHEVAHVVRRDQIVVLLQNLVSVIYWPHPLVKILNRELAKAREEVCDNFVLASTEAPDYSRTLLSLAQLVRRPETMPGSVGFFASRWKLEQRVAGLLDERRDRTTLLSKRGWAFVAATSAGLAILMCLGTITMATAQITSKGESNAEVFDAASFTVTGAVWGPDAKPVSGARVIALQHYHANTSWNTTSEILAETTSDKDGHYQLKLTPSSTRFSDGTYLEVRSMSILAAHARFGPDEQTVLQTQPEVNLQLAVANVPLLGRVLDLEGRPVAGVRVRVLKVDKPNLDFGHTDAVEKWAEQAKTNAPALTQDSKADPFAGPNTDRVSYYPSGNQIDGIGYVDIETITDDEGRFRIDSIGDDRLAILRMDGPGIASLVLPVVARAMQPVNTPGIENQYRLGKTFGNEFDLAAEPNQIVSGVIRDRVSGRSISGASISLRSFPGNTLNVDGFLSTTSDVKGRYQLSGLPRNGNQAGRSIVLSIEPPSDQPYFRSDHSVPVSEGLDPIEFDIEMTRGVWAEGQVTDAKSGDPIASIVGYHPYLDNKNAEGHEAFDAGMMSMGDDEMFATDANGNFRVPALQGKGVLRVVAANSSNYEIVPVPGTKLLENGSVMPGNPKIYHVITPGNAIVDLEIDKHENAALVNVKLQPLETLTLRIVDPSGNAVSGFNVGGRQVKERMMLTGRGARFWQDEPSSSSTVEVILGEGTQRDRPVILLDLERELGAVLWLNELDQAQESPLVITLQPCAKIIGQFVDAKGVPVSNALIESVIFSNNQSGKKWWAPLNGVMVSDEQGRFEVIAPPNSSVSAIVHRKDDIKKLMLLNNTKVVEGETVDLGTIDVTADPKSWPKPIRAISEAALRETNDDNS